MKTDAPRETLGARILLGRTYGALKPLEALGHIGQFGRQASNFDLETLQALGRLTGSLLSGDGVADIGTAPCYAFNQALFPELRVGVLHGHQRYAELSGIGPAAGEAIPRAERPRGDLVSEFGGDFSGVGLPLRL